MARQMKDSGVEWIGEIPEDWYILPLGNCFDERNEKVSDYDWEPLSVTKQGIVEQLETAAKSDAHDARKKFVKMILSSIPVQIENNLVVYLYMMDLCLL